jgi:predicted nucleic acid-binding protein
MHGKEMNEAFLDANILLGHLRVDDPELFRKATTILQAFADAFHAALMQELGISQLLSLESPPTD